MSSMIPPAGYSIAIPTGTAPSYQDAIAQDPFYKQNVAWLQEDTATQKTRLQADQALAEKLYALNVQQATQSIAGVGQGGGDYGMAAAQATAGLQKETAAHDDALRKEQIREILASKGMVDSGQNAWEQQERQYDLSTLLKGIEIDLQARASAAANAASSAASARSSAQAGLQLQLQEMALRHQAGQTSSGYALEDLTSGLAKGTGGAAFDTYQRLLASGALAAPSKMAAWDATSGLYKTADGQFYDASGNPTSWSPPPAAVDYGNGGATGPYGNWSYQDTQVPGLTYGPSGAATGPGGGKTFGI